MRHRFWSLVELVICALHGPADYFSLFICSHVSEIHGCFSSCVLRAGVGAVAVRRTANCEKQVNISTASMMLNCGSIMRGAGVAQSFVDGSLRTRSDSWPGHAGVRGMRVLVPVFLLAGLKDFLQGWQEDGRGASDA